MEQRLSGTPNSELDEIARMGEEANRWDVFLDGLVAVSESWKLLIGIPVIVGIFALIATLVLPRTYTTVARIGPVDAAGGAAAGVVMRSPMVLDRVLQKFPDYPGRGWDQDARRQYLDSKIRWTAIRGGDAKNVFYALEMDDKDPERNRALATALIDSWLIGMKPPPETKARLERMLEFVRTQFQDLERLIADMQKRPELLLPDIKAGYFPLNIGDLIRTRAETAARIEDLKGAIEGVSPDLIRSPPTIETRPRPSRVIVVLSAAVVGFVAALAFVLLRQFVHLLSQNPLYLTKLDRIRAAFSRRVGVG